MSWGTSHPFIQAGASNHAKRSSALITNSTPETWQELQAQVGQILSECGFTVEVEKTVRSARGDVEIDVFAVEDVQGRRYSLACECKHWRRAIPQTVVHAFRTVVAEIGANVGYLISLAGFQSGAVQAGELTNLQLVTWEQFQALFEVSWYDRFLSMQVRARLSGLMTYSEPFLPAWWDKMSPEDQAAYMALKEKHDVFGLIMQSFGGYSRQVAPSRVPIESLPIRPGIQDGAPIAAIPAPILDATSYREFLNMSLAHGEEALAEFRVLRDRYTERR